MTNPLSSILDAKRSCSIPVLFSSSSASESSNSDSGQDSPISLSGRFDIQDNTCNNNKKKLSGSTTFKLLDVLSGHVGGVSCLALCGEFVLSASQGKDIIVWQQPDLRQFTRFGSGEGSVKALVTVGNKVFTAHQDSLIRVWKVSKRSENAFRLVDTLPTTKDYLGKFMKQGNYVEIRRHHKKLWIQHADSISCLAEENGLLYSGSWDKTLKLWRMSDLRCLDSVKAHDDAINGLVSKRGKVYSASADGKIKVWEKEGNKSTSWSLRLKGIMEGHKDVSINAMSYCEAGKGNKKDRVYGGASDGYLMAWEMKESESDKNVKMEWKMVVEVKAHEMAVLCLSVMGDILCTGSADKSICLWKIEKDVIIKGGLSGVLNKVGVIRGHDGPVKCLQLSPFSVGNGYLLYTGSFDKTLKVWWVPKEINKQQDI